MIKPFFFLACLGLGTGLLTSCDSPKTTETTAATATAAPADSAGGMTDTGHAGMDHGSPAGASGMTAAMNTMMKNMDAFKPAGNTDHDFAHMMMAHHQGAVEMSALELKQGKDATLRAMAEKISADQKQELQALEAIATRLDGAPANYKPQDATDPFTNKMKASMAGMMNLGQPSGNVDQDYAALMVPHHQSAVDMAKAELAHGRDTKLKEMAQRMITAQEKEIQQFKAWQAKNGRPTSGTAAVYECPMNDGGRASAPGQCPKCGMDLVKKG